MEIEIATIGGYEEVGRQMTAVRANNDIVIFDMGLNLSKVLIHDDVRTERMHSLDLIDMDRFRELGREGVLCYIEDCTNANKKGRTPSEAVARQHLKDVLYSLEDYDGGIVATTFSSHIARVTSLVEFAKDIGRQPVLLGRSMEQYSGTAERMGVVDFPEELGMYGHRNSVDKTFTRIMEEGKENFLPVVTGHQGEPRAMLTRMGRGETPYELEAGDKVIFSARVIPEPTNEGQRYQAETLLRMQGARI